MVSVDARHTGELGLESLLRHFFKNLNQPLALQGPPAGQTVRHPPLYDHKPVVKPFKKWWTIRYSGKVIHWITIRKVVHPCWTNSLVDNPQVGKTTMNQIKHCASKVNQYNLNTNRKYLPEFFEPIQNRSTHGLRWANFEIKSICLFL